ncbi:PAS domain S-box protein [Methanosarcina sp.]|uniref:PAS domain S-box protein n=1 Tax=Methanosarcina sp. TaxID=2213 RepID=UPI002ABC6CDA|nr:PAS domain S-box protein [Methanosarcina sp.]MDY9925835.1 PAS domain S-box protein [Methanosarcina sp.]
MTNSDRLYANELESRVRERTAELEKANQRLRAEILERKRAENELVKLKDKLEVEVRDTNILHKLSTQYIEGGDSYSIFQEIIEAAIAITRADKGNIQILDPLTGKLKIVAQRGFKLPFLKFFEFVNTEEAAACGAAMKRMERVIVEDITRSPIFLGSDALDMLLSEGVRAVQSTPLVSRSGQFIGIISTHFSQIHMPSERELILIDILARQAADIIERRRTEEMLSHERSLLESVMRATDVMLVFLDPQFNFVWVNPAYAESCQMKPEEMIGKNHFALYPHAENEAIFWKVRDTGEEIFYKDKPFVYPDQPERGVTYWDWSLAPVKNSGGNVNGLVLSLRETTKYKQAEEALLKSEERYRMLFTNMTEAFFLAEIICDKDGKPCDYLHLELNPAYEIITGIKKEQILGKSALEVFPNASPIAIRKFGEVALSGESTHFEIFSQATGKYLDIYAFSLEKGKFAAIFRDITEHKQSDKALYKAYEQIQKQSEELQVSHEELQVQYEKLQETNKALHESEARLQIIIANSPEIIFEQDHDLRYTWIYNPASPYSVSDVIGKTDADLLSPDQAQQLESIKRRVLNTGTREQALLQLTLGGEQRWFEAIYEPRYDETGQVTGVLSYTRDVTERKQAEELLRQSEERYRTLFNSIDEGFCIIEMIFDASGKPIDYRFLETNPAFERQTGLHEAIGKTMLELVPDHEKHWFEIYGTIALNGEPRHFISKAKPLMGGWYDVYAFQFGERGSNKVAILFNDITEQKEAEIKLKETLDNLENLVKERTTELEKAYYSLKESEGKLKALFKLLPVGVSITDKERNILDVNLALENILGLSRSDLLKGKQSTRKYIRLDGTEMSYEEFPSVRALKDEGSIQSSEIGIIKENGSIIWTDVSAIALPSSDGQVVITTRDITELKQEEHRIRRYNSVLEGINRIFGGVVRADTEEDLGNSCISVALEVTGSQIGFIGEVGADGLLHDIAISDTGWNQCLMYDKTGYSRRPHGDFILQGLYGCIIDTGRSFFINYPLSYPDSIGVPSGHPLLTSFLGAPLLSDGKMIGVIAVANREGGYTCEQQEDLEAIAPAVAQALQRKKAEQILAKIDIARQKEIHHRIKNNLQVISSLLDLQAEKFNNRECIQDSEILKAFRESQDRVTSMALIHEELYRGGGFETLNFSPYLQRLVESLFQTYSLGNIDINLNMDLDENLFFDMDTAVPLGMIVNELVSNSLKHAFIGRDKGEIRIKLFSEEDKKGKSTRYTLVVSDKGVGISENIDFENPDTLGLQLVSILVDQLDGEIDLRKDYGTEFTIRLAI